MTLEGERQKQEDLWGLKSNKPSYPNGGIPGSVRDLSLKTEVVDQGIYFLETTRLCMTACTCICPHAHIHTHGYVNVKQHLGFFLFGVTFIDRGFYLGQE